MSKKSCHGCEGKGWVLILKSERITPFLSKADGMPVPGVGIAHQEYGADICLICGGSGEAKIHPMVQVVA